MYIRAYIYIYLWWYNKYIDDYRYTYRCNALLPGGLLAELYAKWSGWVKVGRLAGAVKRIPSFRDCVWKKATSLVTVFTNNLRVMSKGLGTFLAFQQLDTSDTSDWACTSSCPDVFCTPFAGASRWRWQDWAGTSRLMPKRFSDMFNSSEGSEFRSLIGVSVCGFSAIFNVGSKDFTSTFDNYISDKLHKPLAILSHHRLQVLTALFWKKAVHCLCIVSDSWRRFCSCHRLRRSKSDSKSMARDSKSLFLPICCCSLWNFVLRLLALVGCSGVPKARSTVFSDKYCPL